MEEARYWMWTKRKNSLSSDQVVASSTKPSTYGDSWEEQAFAEDAAGPLGGCIWPPRSYSCTFCRREFRSAQALGGHMNVHRRDRARLKQSPSPNNHLSSPTASLGIHQYPSQISTFAYGQDSSHGFLASPNSSPSRVSVPLIQVNCNEKALSSPLFSSPFFQEQQKRTSILSPQLWSSMVADRYCNILDLEKEEKNLNFLESKYYRANNKRDYLAADLSVSLNFVVCGNNNQTASSGEEDDSMSFKRRRTDDATVSFFPKQTSAGKSIVHPQSVVEVSPSSKEDLDLELRLGESIHLR